MIEFWLGGAVATTFITIAMFLEMPTIRYTLPIIIIAWPITLPLILIGSYKRGKDDK